MNRATSEYSRMAPTRSSGDFIVKLKEEYTFLPFYVWISEFRLGGYFLKPCFLNRQFKKSSQGTVLNFHGNRQRVTQDIWPTKLKILFKNLPLFDWRYIKSCQIGIKQLYGGVILNLGYYICLASSQRCEISNPVLFYGKKNFSFLIFQRCIA